MVGLSKPHREVLSAVHHIAIAIDDVKAADPGWAGSKAANLARLRAAGFAVPAGFVVGSGAFSRTGSAELAAAIEAAAATLGDGPFAVRSSASAEDLPDASYAGLYETYLNVPRGDLVDAVRRCSAAVDAPRVAAYRKGRGVGGPNIAMAVLVQDMVAAEAAGVAFTANPVTGDRTETIITAVRGLGERLVGGEAAGDEWVVRGDRAACRRSVENAIDVRLAAEVAHLARTVEAHFGVPQDIEWACADGKLWLLQARPMTALPDLPGWEPPGPGVWLRNQRLGEWLPDPLTPLFAEWLLPHIIDGVADGMRGTVGVAIPFGHAVVNGWYYTTPIVNLTPSTVVRGLTPAYLRGAWFMYGAVQRALRNPVAAEAFALGRLYREWRDRMLPDYQRLVTEAEAQVDAATPKRLLELADQVARTAGLHMWYIMLLGGSAWKMEKALTRFHRRHLRDILPDGVAVLLAGLPGVDVEPPEWSVTSIDWHQPTLGELPAASTAPTPRDRKLQLTEARRSAEEACRRALASRPRQAARFDTLLDIAQRYAVIREEQARHLTVGWPLLRHVARRLGKALTAAGVIGVPEDLFFLTYAELEAGIDGSPSHPDTDARRTVWQRQRRLTAPLQLGRTPRFVPALLAGYGVGRSPSAEAVVKGQAASPGRATGLARIVLGPDDFALLRPGDVLVAPTTTPGWTPLFARAAAVITDGGNLASHASLVAREYGIPAVVGTGDATLRLNDGQTVTVDGTTGTVTTSQ
jgi:pyruvate,water dikinase